MKGAAMPGRSDAPQKPVTNRQSKRIRTALANHTKVQEPIKRADRLPAPSAKAGIQTARRGCDKTGLAGEAAERQPRLPDDTDLLDAFDPDEMDYEPLPEHGDFHWENDEPS